MRMTTTATAALGVARALALSEPKSASKQQPTTFDQKSTVHLYQPEHMKEKQNVERSGDIKS